MGARALVAYERADGRYSLHYSHWGAAALRLRGALTPDAPFGGGVPGERRALAAIQAGGDAADLPPLDPADTLVNPAPLVTGLTREAVAERVDFHAHEALYVVSLALDVAAYVPLRADLSLESPRDEGDPTAGVLAHADDERGAERLREWADGARTVLADTLDRGGFDPPASREYLAGKLRERAGDTFAP